MDREEALGTIIKRLETISGVAGVFLSGSLVNEDQDEFSDIDLGIATKNSAKAFNEVYGLRRQILAASVEPICLLEKGWGHCKMIAALFGKTEYPPTGLEADLIFSQLRYVPEQMPYSKSRVVFDRSRKLQAELAMMSQPRPAQEIEEEIGQHLIWFPFYSYDALKACRRKDEFQAQSLLEEMRKLIFFAAAARQGRQIFGSKRAYRCLTARERQILEESYRRTDEAVVAQLAQVYLECVAENSAKYQLAEKIGSFQNAMRELL